MRFQESIIALAAALSISSVALATVNVPDGGYTVDTLEDGSTRWTSTTDSTVQPITVPKPEAPKVLARSAKFTKRRTDCWGNGLDRAGVDGTLNSLRGWANQGTTLTSDNGPKSFGYVLNGVFSYYCITRAHTSGNLDINDVNYAISQMDAKCASYTASWVRIMLCSFCMR